MKQMKFSPDIVPSTKYAVYWHHIDQYFPFVGKFNYGKTVFLNWKGYCVEHDYDLITSDTAVGRKPLLGNYYFSGQYQQVSILLQKYDYVFIGASDVLLKRTLPSLQQIVVDNIHISYAACKPVLNRNMDDNSPFSLNNPYPCSINHTSASAVFKELHKAPNRDIALNRKRVTLPSRHLSQYSFDTHARYAMSIGHGGIYYNTIKDLCSYNWDKLQSQYLFNMLYFDGCGVGGDIWRLRPIMINTMIKIYKDKLYWSSQ